MVTSPMVTTVSSGWNSRDTSLYGWLTWMTSSTPWSDSKWAGSTTPRLPVMPIAVRWAPGIGCALRPRPSTFRTTPST